MYPDGGREQGRKELRSPVRETRRVLSALNRLKSVLLGNTKQGQNTLGAGWRFGGMK